MHDDVAREAWAQQERIAARCCHAAGGFEPIDLPRPEDLLARFEQGAARWPDALALAKGDDRLSYRDLNGRANRLARRLRSAAGPGDEPVALLFDNGPATVVAMLSVWKAGKFFVVLDPAAPAERLAAILADSGAAWLMAEPALAKRGAEVIAGGAARLFEATDDPAQASHDLGIAPAPGALACLVYTSGTTGRPKGVMVGYACLAGRVSVVANRSRTGRHDREGIVRTLSFIGDLGVTVNVLVTGASAHFLDFRAAGLAGLKAFLREERITILSPGVTLYRQLVATLSADDVFPSMRLLRLAGEQVTADDLRALARHFPPECLIRIGYSSTETGTITDFFADRSTTVSPGAAPCGYPPPGVRVTLERPGGGEVHGDEPGEIVVRTPSLALGYWRQPQATPERFRRGPDGAVTFRTGDIGKRLSDGSLVVLGRADDQVKVRGHRVEPAEIEAALLACDGVRGAAVGSRPDAGGVSRLTAYVVCADDTPGGPTALRSVLAARLPDYMVPQRFVQVDAVPVTLNGKVDWRALPPPPADRPDLGAPYVAPRGALEALAADIWQQVLRVEPIGVHDDFLDLGGDSVSAALVVARLADRLGLEDRVPPALLEAGTVATMTAALAPLLMTTVREGTGREADRP